MINATAKTGFLIEDGAKLGTAVAYLRACSAVLNAPHVREIADYLDTIRALTYYAPVPTTEEIEIQGVGI